MNTPFDLRFTSNWNNKLDCHAFTTLRLFNPSLHFIGKRVHIWLNDDDKGTGEIKAIRRFLLTELNEFVAYLDTGYSPDETRKIFHNMYHQIDFATTKFALLLIIKDKIPKHEKAEPTPVQGALL